MDSGAVGSKPTGRKTRSRSPTSGWRPRPRARNRQTTLSSRVPGCFHSTASFEGARRRSFRVTRSSRLAFSSMEARHPGLGAGEWLRSRSNWRRSTTGPRGASGCLPVLRGFVNRLDLFRSTALLLRHHKLDGDGFVGDSFWSEMSCSGIPLPELYRLLLASAGRGGPDLFRLDGDGLVNYREPGMRHGFRDVERLVSSGK